MERGPAPFHDRAEAATLLASELARYDSAHPLVLAIPRGALPMARIIADKLGGDLDVVLVRKLGAPGNPELAVGSVAENGWTHIARHATEAAATQAYLEREKQTQLELLRRRRARYTPRRAAINATGRTVIVIDDGMATGATMMAALHAVRACDPAQLICAVPVASTEALTQVSGSADQIVSLVSSDEFDAISRFYEDFPQVSDDEVIAILEAARIGSG
ncbi:MAG TPA: phosphoribosyltransferase family protein [Burkholderiales bacterium]|nr:phosphoribosyltransferase family protein [Burkholderiales bacterium]